MSTEDTFISHLIELRDRLLRAILAVLFVFLVLFYWAADIYALLARPLLAALPADGKMIATDVVGVFLVPVKVTLLVSFLLMLPYVLYQVWAFVAPGLYVHEKRLVLPLVVTSSILFFADVVRILRRVPFGIQVHGRDRPRRRGVDDRHREVLQFRPHHVHRLWRDIRNACRGGAARQARGGEHREA